MLDLVVTTIGAEAAQRKDDAALIQKGRTQTAARFRQAFGVDLDALRVTREGFARA